MSEKWAVYNPHEKLVDELPTIFGFNNGGSAGFLHGALVSEGGGWLGGHVCSSEGFMLGDLGILEGSRDDRHEGFREHYPDGYRMEFVKYDDVPGHAKLMEAIRIADERAEGHPSW